MRPSERVSSTCILWYHSCSYTSFVICGWHFLSLGGFACPRRWTESAWVGENGLPGNLKLVPVRVGPLVTLEGVRQRIAALFHSVHPLRRFCPRLNRSNYLVTLSFLPVSHGCQLDRGHSRWTFLHRSLDDFFCNAKGYRDTFLRICWATVWRDNILSDPWDLNTFAS